MARPAVIRGPVFGVPPAPAVTAGVEPIRIVDPAGGAIAWIAPGARAGCTGFAVHRPGPPAAQWIDVLPPGDANGPWITPMVMLDGPSAEGGAARNAQNPPLGWRFAERDPTMVALDAEGPSGVRLRFAASLDDSALTLSIDATNGGAGPVAIRLGLRFRVAFDTPANGPAANDSGIQPAPVAARWRAADGAALAITAVEGVDAAHIDATTDAVGGHGLSVLGLRAPHGLAHLPPGSRMRVAASIGTIER